MSCPVGNDVARAAALLRSGGIVAFPTETVYGLGGNALDAAAVARIFDAKGRPWFDPLIVHVASLSDAERLVTEFSPAARALAAAFWPGPLSLVLPKAAEVPDLVTAGLPTVAIRVPNHPVAVELLRLSGVPIAAPSANLFGRLSPTTAQHVAEQLGDRIDYILDGGPSQVGVESTILEAGHPPRLLRPGGIPLEQIEQLIGPVVLAVSTDRPGEAGVGAEHAQAAPGMLPQHYAPRTPLRLEPPSAGEAARLRIGALLFTRAAPGSHYHATEILSPQGSLPEAAARFFAALRRLDALGLDLIVAETFPEEGLGRALNDRLRRAASATGRAREH